jgi:hypothetical protein
MNTPLPDVQAIAALMSPPAAGYLALVESLRPVPRAPGAPGAGEAMRHFAQFAERIRDLDDDELGELYEVSFSPVDADALARAAEAVRANGSAAFTLALPVLQALLGPLEAARNPFAALFKGLCCVLLASRPASVPAAGGFTQHTCSRETT